MVGSMDTISTMPWYTVHVCQSQRTLYTLQDTASSTLDKSKYVPYTASPLSLKCYTYADIVDSLHNVMYYIKL